MKIDINRLYINKFNNKYFIFDKKENDLYIGRQYVWSNGFMEVIPINIDYERVLSYISEEKIRLAKQWEVIKFLIITVVDSELVYDT
jgi:hypothetical protein